MTSLVVCGAGPGLGRAIARRYAEGGYEIALVARRRDALESAAEDLRSAGAAAHVVAADLSDVDSVPALVEQIRRAVGTVDALYYAPTPEAGFVRAADLTAASARAFMPLVFYTFVSLVHHLLPSMLQHGDGALLTAQGASTLHGLPGMSGPGPAQAAQRNYLQSLSAELAGSGVYVGMLYIGALIEKSAFHAQFEQTRAAGEDRDWGGSVDPDHLANLLWNMHQARRESEATYTSGSIPALEEHEQCEQVADDDVQA
jgi:NADP-dependent 3-hydroxy acid dehydrogenase YdfG